MRTAASSVVVALTGLACAVAPERLLLNQFFAASRLRDLTALSRFSTVVFEPHVDGIVERFVVVGSTRERRVGERQAPGDAAGPSSEMARVIRLSLEDPTDPVDQPAQTPVLVEKDVTVSAQVGLADGTAATRSLVLTLQRARVEADGGRAGRWIVVRFVY